MDYPNEWDDRWISTEEYLKLTETMILGGYVAYNSKGEVGMRLQMHVPEWIKDAREL